MRRSVASQRRARQQSAKIGDEVLLARVTLALTRQQAADRAGVSWSTEARVELGDQGVSIGTMCAVAEAVGLDIVVKAFEGRQPSLRDTGQLELAELLRTEAHPSLNVTIELAIGEHGQAIDEAFFSAQEIIATEIERMATDFQGQYRRAERKREALQAQHQRPVRLVMTFEDTRRNRAALEPHLTFIRTALPAGSREVLAALRTGTPLGRDGLLWIRRRRNPR